MYALFVVPNGDVVAAGGFLTRPEAAPPTPSPPNGASWLALGSGMDDTVFSLANLANGDLVAGGYFASAGGVVARSIARWDDASWSPLDNGMLGGFTTVSAMLTRSNGDLIAGGFFTTAGSSPSRVTSRVGMEPPGPPWCRHRRGCQCSRCSPAAMSLRVAHSPLREARPPITSDAIRLPRALPPPSLHTR